MARDRDYGLYGYTLETPIFEILAECIGKDYCPSHDGIANATHTYINPSNGRQQESCEDCRPDGWVRRRETKD